MMGSEGLKKASQTAILNANYIAHKLKDSFPILYKGKSGNVAHECIIDIRKIKSEMGITEEDIAKSLPCGTVSINTFSEGDIKTPFGGYKQSGSLNRDQGTEALNQYLQTKTIWISHS